MVIYIAGPYRGKTEIDVLENIQNARVAAIEIWEAGHVALCPHLNTANFEDDCKCSPDDYLAGDFEMLARCDAIYLIRNWPRSKGAVEEKAFADQHGIPCYGWLYEGVNGDVGIPPAHPVESSCPNQAREFLYTVMRMYRLHLSKNSDYSPANILATGELGLVTRTWDKVARLMSLTGFKFDVTNARLGPPKQPKHESIEDTFLDLAVYAVIGLLLHRGKWGC